MNDRYAATDDINDIGQYFPQGITADILNNPTLLEQFLEEYKLQYEEMQQNYSVYRECVVPIVTQSFGIMWYILFFCIVIRVVGCIKAPRNLLHLASAIFGIICLWKFYEEAMTFVLLPTVVLTLVLQIRKLSRGLCLSLMSITYLIACELMLDAVKWNMIKGSVMTVLMKIISLGFDTETNQIKSPITMLEIFGYILNPASVIFGPFITFKDYNQIFDAHPMTFSWLFHSCSILLLSVVCLIWSSCGISNYLPMLEGYISVLQESKWWAAYKDAQAFRFGHYYVGYFSEVCCLAMGVAILENVKNESSKNKSDVIKGTFTSTRNEASSEINGVVTPEETVDLKMVLRWERPVARMLWIELPRSLVDVVTNWNLPMHYWLKQYVFKSSRRYGVFVAILVTYVASSLLHGLNFQLSAILLSIGIFAYVESVARHALSDMFDICVEARGCKTVCKHKYGKDKFWVVAINAMFTLLAVWNLAYLGCPFDGSAEQQEQGYSMAHTMRKWSEYNYLNHIVMLVGFLLQKIVVSGRIF